MILHVFGLVIVFFSFEPARSFYSVTSMPTYYLQFSLPFSLCSVNVIYNITIRHWTDSLASLPKYVFIRKELYVIALFTSLYVKWTLWVSFLGPLGVETLAMLKTKRCIIDCCEWKMQQVDWLVCVASTNQLSRPFGSCDARALRFSRQRPWHIGHGSLNLTGEK